MIRYVYIFNCANLGQQNRTSQKTDTNCQTLILGKEHVFEMGKKEGAFCFSLVFTGIST